MAARARRGGRHVLAIESLVFIPVHARYYVIMSIIVSGALGLFMAFLAYGRMVLNPSQTRPRHNSLISSDGIG
jgi:hypothetical protein